MGKNNGSVPGTFVSNQDIQELNNLLSTFRDYILSHEARLELIEGWINEFMQKNAPEFTPETDGTAEATSEDSTTRDADASTTLTLVEPPVDESTDDSTER